MSSYYWHKIIWSICLLGSVWLFSCEERIEPTYYGQLEGTVRDVISGDPIPGVALTSTATNSTVTTNDTGYFFLDRIEVGEYTLTLKATGYRSTSQSFQVSRDDTTKLSLFMEENPNNNTPPLAAFSPRPGNASDTASRQVTLSWKGLDEDEEDSVLRYDLVFYRANNQSQQVLLNNSPDTSYVLGDLQFGTTYYWQVTTRDAQGAQTQGPLWSFRTRELPDHRLRFVREINGEQIIYSSTITGGDSFLLTAPNLSSWQPRLNSQRNEVAFVRRSGLDNHLFLMDREGNQVRQITNIPLGGYHNPGIGFTWSPDGTQLVYSRYNQLYRIDRDGGNLQVLATAPSDRHFRSCDWSAATNQIVVETVAQNGHEGELYLVNPAQAGDTTLLLADLPGAFSSPSFSEDGSQVLFSHDISGFTGPTGRQLDARVFLLNLNTGQLTDLSAQKTPGTNDLEAHFAPDGGSIIFTNYSNANLRPPQIMRMALNGQNREILVENAFMADWQ